MLGSEPSTFRTWVSSHNHETKTSAQLNAYFVSRENLLHLIGGAAIAQWFNLRLPSCRMGLSPKQTMHAFIIYSQICVVKRTKITKKGAGFGPFLVKKKPPASQLCRSNKWKIEKFFVPIRKERKRGERKKSQSLDADGNLHKISCNQKRGWGSNLPEKTTNRPSNIQPIEQNSIRRLGSGVA